MTTGPAASACPTLPPINLLADNNPVDQADTGSNLLAARQAGQSDIASTRRQQLDFEPVSCRCLRHVITGYGECLLAMRGLEMGVEIGPASPGVATWRR
jgi:hypothetical protein